MDRTFANFATEKKYYQHNDPGYMWGSHWGGIEDSLDRDIRTFIGVINALPYTFSKGMCCSGSYQDHHDLFSENAYEFHLSKGSHNGRFGIRLNEPQGYAVIRMNDLSTDSSKLRKILERAPLSVLLPSTKGECSDMVDNDITPGACTYTYQIFMPPHQRLPLPNDQEYMGRIWRNIVVNIATFR